MPQPRISIIGSGVVGQATGRGFLRRGGAVTFVDINAAKVQQLRQEGLMAYTPGELLQRGDTFDIVFFTVSTPTMNGQINLDHLKAATIEVGRRLALTPGYQVVVVRSTVVPGTSDEMVIPLLQEYSGKQVGRDFGVCMNPEYLREKTSVRDFDQPWIVVIGQHDQRAGDILAALYRGFDCPTYRLTLREAEMQKYVHNLFNAVKITFFNEMRGICERLGADAEALFPLVAKSAEGMWNPAYGIKNSGPFDGMCLPKDTQAFLSWAQEKGWSTPLIATAIAVNQRLVPAQAATVADEAVAAPAHAVV